MVFSYGFDEVSDNFQQHSNFGRGGAEGDGIIANAQMDLGSITRTS